MPRSGAIVFGDLIGKLDSVRVTCDRCGRDGRYQFQNFISERGGDGKIVDLARSSHRSLSDKEGTQLE